MKKITLACTITFLLSACSTDDNAEPVYGKETGLPVNCRAYVQVAIVGYRMGRYTADEAFSGLERNCGLHGLAWKDNRK